MICVKYSIEMYQEKILSVEKNLQGRKLSMYTGNQFKILVYPEKLKLIIETFPSCKIKTDNLL